MKPKRNVTPAVSTFGASKRDPDVPRHVAIVMDGNGRWAKKRFMPWSFASRRRLRIATLLSSPWLLTIFVRSRRRSSVSAGIGTRMMSPVVDGFRPRSDSRIAFSTFWIIGFSHGCTLIVRASSSDRFATWLSGTGEP